MIHRSFLLILVLVLSSSLADAEPIASRGPSVIQGGPGVPAKAVVDTINLLAARNDPTNGAGEPAYLGDFDDLSQFPAWNGWSSVDLTQEVGQSHWKVSDYRHLNGELSAWCGEPEYPSCQTGDSLGGYGNSWHDRLEWRQVVADPAQPCTVTLDAWLNLDVQVGYDYGILSVLTADGGVVDLWSDYGLLENYHLQQSFVFQPGDYTGDAADEIAVQFRVVSDGGGSDADCIWPTRGAMQVDDVAVTLSQGGVSTFDDFEDGTLGNWTALDRPGAGDFANIWVYLEDIDPCRTNYTSQVAFIDDGQVVPGTGGTMCITWCYGPEGYIVNPTGGLSFYPKKPLHNAVDSPVMDWPQAQASGALLEFDVYHQYSLTDDDAPQIFYAWSVRSADTDGSGGAGPQDIADQPWVDRGGVYWGDANYERYSEEIGDLLVPGVDQVQVRLAVRQLESYSYNRLDGTPTPYFDNATLKVYERDGPAMIAGVSNLAQDAFPESGTLDFEDRGSLSVRFDMARDISPFTDYRNDPGDSIVVRVAPLAVGAVLSPAPRMQYLLRGNPDYDPYRTAGLPDAGFVAGTEVRDDQGQPTGEWAFDLPDTGFFYPGDEIHYLIVATETGPGGTVQSFLPADTTSYHDFSGPLAYDPNFTVRALPGLEDWYDKTVISSGGPALFWFDAEDLAGLELWLDALEEFNPTGQPQFTTFDFDVFVTRSPASGVGNGLGGRATPEQLDHYGTVLYSSGSETYRTLGAGPAYGDDSDDVGLLEAWLATGDRNLLLAGDGLASDLAAGSGTSAFLTNRMGVSFVADYIRPLIANQVTPKVKPDPAAGMFYDTPAWVAYGGCPKVNRFDAVEPTNGGVRSAEFLAPWGAAGVYSYAAATVRTADGNVVYSLPYDLMFVYTDQVEFPPNGLSARESLLGDVLLAFQYMWGPIGDAPDAAIRFSADVHPNPFNPLVTIAYTVPAPGRLSVKVYDVRGRLVRTVMDRRVETSGKTAWDGTDDRGRASASGVYFYEVRQGENVEIGKMALIR